MDTGIVSNMSSTNTQFSIAVHVLSCLADRQESLTSTVIAGSVNANPIFVKRILAKLSKADIIETSVGKSGGCLLAKKPKDITLKDVFDAVEAPGPFAVHEYAVVKTCGISSNIKKVMNEHLEKSQDLLNAYLGKITLEQMLRDMKKRS